MNIRRHILLLLSAIAFCLSYSVCFADELPEAVILSGTGNDYAGAFDMGAIDADMDVMHIANTNDTFNHYGASSNDVFYRFILKEPMLVTFDHVGSGVPGSYIYIVHDGVTDDFDIDLSELSCGQDWNYALSHFEYMDYERESYDASSSALGVIYEYLDAGTYYLIGERMSSNAGSRGGIIRTNFHFHSIPGGTDSNPIDIGNFLEFADTTFIYELQQYPLAEKRSAVYFSATFSNPFEIAAEGVFDAIDVSGKNGESVYSDNTPGIQHVFEISPRRYIFKLSYESPEIEAVILHLTGCRIIPEGSDIEHPIYIGTFHKDFSADEQLCNGKFYSFSISAPMELQISTTAAGRLSLLRSNAVIRESNSKSLAFKTLPAGTYIFSNDTGKDDGYYSLAINGRLIQDKDSYSYSFNYIRAYEPLEAFSSRESLSASNSRTSLRYYDRLGRPFEEIAHKMSPSGKDIIRLSEYDKMGRVAKVWKELPYLSDGAAVSPTAVLWESLDFHNDSIAHTKYGYGKDVLDRIHELSGPGQAWRNHNHTVRHFYNLNKDTCCRRFTVDKDNNLIDIGYYEPGTLNIETLYDEDWRQTERYTDSRGNLILERKFDDGIDFGTYIKFDTYYVYDNLNRLHYVLPPEASVINDLRLAVNDYAFIYRYGPAGLATWKRIPGKSWCRYIYNRHREPIGEQDSLMRARGVFLLNIPDNFGRPAIKAFVDDTFPEDLEMTDLRVIPDTSGTGYRWAESSDYRTFSLPEVKNLPEILSVNYYDDYTYLQLYPCRNLIEADNAGVHSDAAALLTGTLSFSLPEKDSIVTSFYYDYRKRLVKSRQTILNGISISQSFSYDFISNLTDSKEIVNTGTASDTLTRRISYDHAGRIMSEQSRLNNHQPAEVSYEYDELGRLIDTELATGKGNLNISDSYNIRDWLISRRSPIFNMELHYNEPADTLMMPSYYSGNISGMCWTYPSYKANRNSYVFSYDGLSRLVSASPSGNDYHHHSEDILAYDRNSNILTAFRAEKKDTLFKMNFKYSGNRIFASMPDITPQQFIYNANGQLTHDGTNGLDISYDCLNQIRDVTKGGDLLARYSYSTDGIKLSAVNASGDGLVYIGDMVYKWENGMLKFDSAPFSQGRIVSCGADIEPHYFITDHLGSVRVELDYAGSIVETNDYYPSGAKWTDTSGRQPSLGSYANRYRYNGKEEQGFLGLPYIDYGARMYNPENMLSWLSADDLAEKYYSLSPYSFCAGNPVNIIDPDGRDIWTIDKNGNIKWEEKSKTHILYSLDNNGNRSKSHISISNRSILDNLTKTESKTKRGVPVSSYTSSTGIDDMFKVFKYASDNSDVEWVIHRDGDTYALGTKHLSDSAGSWDDYLENSPQASVHSHPGVKPTTSDEIDSMGYTVNVEMANGDYYNVIRDIIRNRQQTRLNYVYFPTSSNLYHVEYPRIRFIRKVSSYKSFYFGTLNHQ